MTDSFILREQDEMAVRLAGFAPIDALPHAVVLSTEAWVGEMDGEVIAAWGYASQGLVGSKAYGWLLTSPSVERYPTRFLRQSRAFIIYVLTLFPCLQVQVHKSHKVSQSWLAWLGFIPTAEDGDFYTLERVR